MSSSLHTILQKQPAIEEASTQSLFRLTEPIQYQGFITKEQAIQILKWKSSRPLKHYEANSNEDFEYFSKTAFANNDDRLKIHILTALKGVSLPAASALLMVWNPQLYPVIDIRAWQQLYKHGLVTENEKGQDFTLKQYQIYVQIVRQLAKDLNITARQVEKRFYDYDKATRKGNLYE